MEIKPNVYFVGAGGIGMAALERYFISRGLNVAGYDRTPSPLTASLQKEGIDITFDDRVEAIPKEFRNPTTTLVVYTPAVPHIHPGLNFFRQNGFDVVKRAEVLGLITNDSKSLCFAGTHGKTTTSSMAAHILHTSKVGCNAFLGGILRNYDSNLLLSDTSPFSVVEADEYDRSFHHLSPYIAVITATDPDHLDIYGTPEAYREAFAHFTELIKSDGFLLVHNDIDLLSRTAKGVKMFTYGKDSGDFHAENIRRGNGMITFDLVTPTHAIKDVELGVPVEINIENSIAAAAACLLTGKVEDEAIKEAIRTFQGAERRFQFHLKEDKPGGHIVIDDYAHHPDELSASIRSIKSLYPGKRLTVAFQPHLYTRTRDFADGFAEALSMADEVILLDIYPAREEPIEGVSSKIIFDKIKSSKKTLIEKHNLTETIKNTKFEILLTAGAGDINLFLPEILKNLKKQDNERQ